LFNFIVENSRWFYRFLEGVFIPLDQVLTLPADASGFPDLPQSTKDWIRQEASPAFQFPDAGKGKGCRLPVDRNRPWERRWLCPGGERLDSVLPDTAGIHPVFMLGAGETPGQ
jgi:hypothetical protein